MEGAATLKEKLERIGNQCSTLLVNKSELKLDIEFDQVSFSLTKDFQANVVMMTVGMFFGMIYAGVFVYGILVVLSLAFLIRNGLSAYHAYEKIRQMECLMSVNIKRSAIVLEELKNLEEEFDRTPGVPFEDPLGSMVSISDARNRISGMKCALQSPVDDVVKDIIVICGAALVYLLLLICLTVFRGDDLMMASGRANI